MDEGKFPHTTCSEVAVPPISAFMLPALQVHCPGPANVVKIFGWWDKVGLTVATFSEYDKKLLK